MARCRARLKGMPRTRWAKLQMLRITRSHETKEGMNGGEPDVSCGHSVLALLFKVGEKREDSGWIQIRQVESRNRLFACAGEKPQQQNHAVAVTVDGVRTGSAKAGKVVGEVVADYGAE